MTFSDHRRKVADTYQFLSCCRGPADKGNDVLKRVIGIDPLKARRFAIRFPKRIFGSINRVEIANEPMHARMVWLRKQMPIETLTVAPLPPLSKLTTHEQHLLSRM